MEKTFKKFLDGIPPEITVETEVYTDSHIAVFRPRSYVIGLEANFEDYHFILPTSDPPPLKIERQVHRFKKGKLLPFAPGTKMLCTEPVPTHRYFAPKH